MPAKPIIGVIGGMGPAAGLDLVARITRLTEARRDAEHLPVVLLSFPGDIPDRTTFLLSGEGGNPGNAILRIALELERTGAAVAGIACNTAHAPEILGVVNHGLREVGSGLRLLNLIDETVAHIRRIAAPGARVGLLSTSGVRHTNLYSDPLREAGFEVVELDEDAHVRLVMDALYSAQHGIKATSRPAEAARRQILEALAILQSGGAEAAILGCTELPLAVPEPTWNGLTLIDPADLLARALIRATYPDRLRSDQS